MLSDDARRELLRRELRAARLGAGLRQVDVAKMLRKPQSYVAKVERGERRLDFVETLNLCKVIGLDPKKLVAKLG